MSMLKEWGIEGKIMSLTLDNAASNDCYADLLKCELNLLSGGQYFHVRCCAHILNLIVQVGLKELDESVSKVRESVKYFKGSQTRKQKFLECVKHCSLDSKKGLRQDVPTRWNSTYLMLESALFYKKAFNHYQLTDANYVQCPSGAEWVKIEKICKFLKVFHEVTKVFSGTKYPTSSLYFANVLKIRMLLKQEMESRDDFMKKMAKEMYGKFEKYWSDFSVIMAFAVVFDPRYKLKVVDWGYKKIYGNEAGYEMNVLKDKLFDLYNEYVAADGSSISSSGDLHTRSSNGLVADSSGSSDPFMMDYDCYTSEETITTSKSELEAYLEEAMVPRNNILDVLGFWKANQSRYPILSNMARDVLAIPISTVASESAFSIGGRVLDVWRSSLLPSNAEALICL